MRHVPFSFLLLLLPLPLIAQSDTQSATTLFASKPHDYAIFIEGGNGVARTGDDDVHLFSAGGRAGWVLTPPAGPGILRGQFEAAVEVYPFWSAYTPTYTITANGNSISYGDHFYGASITPANFRWNFVGGNKWVPWFQGAGGLVWTNHKFPPGPTSVWNFTPQFGVGTHYFVRPNRSLDFSANAVHISSASLGDKNPGINASVQFALGYSWWK